MYLSRLILNPRSRAVQRDLARPHELHRTILRAFPDNLDKADERVLHRLDQTGSGGLHLLVQSRLRPDWTFLQESGYLSLTQLQNPAVKEIDLHVNEGQALTFRLRANPTKRLSAGKGNKGKRVGLYAIEDQLAWLERKGSDHGFVIQSVLSTQQQRIEARIPGNVHRSAPTQGEGKPEATHHNAKFFSVQYDGILRVRDPDRFLSAIASGIGSGKAFGCGLLSVAPVR